MKLAEAIPVFGVRCVEKVTHGCELQVLLVQVGAM
jgi:hypothetical protein